VNPIVINAQLNNGIGINPINLKANPGKHVDKGEA
jgi:hypothetical protein